MKKGISPIISYAIIVGLVILFFVLTGSWFKEFSDEILEMTSEGSSTQMTCTSPGAALDIDSACYNKDDAILVLGAGSLEFERFDLYLTADKQVTLETSTGLQSYGIKRFLISEDSEDLTQASQNALRDLNLEFRQTSGIKVIPTILSNKKEAICSNLVLEARNLECCKGGDGCGCDDNEDCDPPHDICDTEDEICVECLEEIHCQDNDIKIHCNLNTNKCVECRDNNDCNTAEGETCQNNQCIPEPCASINLDDYNVEEGTNSICMSNREIKLSITGISSEITDFRIKIFASGENDPVYNEILTKQGGSASLNNIRYHDNFTTNNFLERIEVIPRVDGDECGDATTSKTLTVVTNEIFKCCTASIQCDENGEPQGGETCCDRDCGENPFTGSAVKEEGDLYEDPDTCAPEYDILKEYICSQGTSEEINIDCSLFGYICPFGESLCLL